MHQNSNILPIPLETKIQTEPPFAVGLKIQATNQTSNQCLSNHIPMIDNDLTRVIVS